MRLVRNSIYNLAGLGLPLLAAVVCIPFLIRELGEARFGLLTLIWAVVSYFGLFDLGLSRALTQLLAIALSQKDYSRSGQISATAMMLMLGLGLLAGISMYVLAPWGLGFIKSIPDFDEAKTAVRWMALAMPFIVMTAGLRGMLEAKHAFKALNLIRLPMGLWTFVGPWLVIIYFGPDLIAISCALSMGRVFACAVHALVVMALMPELKGAWSFEKLWLRPLAVSGGWLSVSNIISPFMGFADRFIIGAVISAGAVAYYTTPQELATKLSIVPGALTAVLFPTLAVQVVQSRQAALLLCKDVLRWLMLVMLPLTLVLVLFANELMSFWISSNFADKSSKLLQLFVVGMFFSSFAQVPYTLIQSAGRAKVTAIIHALEMPIFLFGLFWVATHYGVEGAAWAWLARIAVDTVVMAWASGRVLGGKVYDLLIWTALLALAGVGLAFVGVLLPSMLARISWLLLSCAIVGFLMLHQIKSPQKNKVI